MSRPCEGLEGATALSRIFPSVCGARVTGPAFCTRHPNGARNSTEASRAEPEWL